MKTHRWSSGCEIVFAVLLLVTAALGFLTPVNAQPVDPLLDEGVQILIEKHEIVHLQKIGQLDPGKAQERLQANKQRWAKYSQKIGQWPKEKQRAFTEELKKQTAAAKVPLDQKWAAEARQLQKDGSAQAGQESVSTATPAQTDTGAARPVGQSQSGPDILGLRIGMTLDEARAIFKSRGFGSSSCEMHEEAKICSSRSGNKPIDDYREAFRMLDFMLPGGRPQTIPMTKYVSSLRGLLRQISTDSNGQILQENGQIIQETERLDALLGPNPGQERIISLQRQLEFLTDKKPTFATFQKALSEKYGPASFSPPGFPAQQFWIYDKSGMLRKPGATSKDYLATCDAPTNSRAEDWIMREGPVKLEHSAAKCGATVLFLIMSFDGGNYGGPDSIVSHYLTDLTGYDAASQAANASAAIREKAQEAATEEKIKQGQKAKPNL